MNDRATPSNLTKPVPLVPKTSCSIPARYSCTATVGGAGNDLALLLTAERGIDSMQGFLDPYSMHDMCQLARQLASWPVMQQQPQPEAPTGGGKVTLCARSPTQTAGNSPGINQHLHVTTQCAGDLACNIEIQGVHGQHTQLWTQAATAGT